MSYEFHLPDIGEGVIEGEVVSWLVAEGDAVALDQPMVEIMTDKATVEIPSPRAGQIRQIRFKVGQICPVGDVLVVIDEPSSSKTFSSSGFDLGRVPTQPSILMPPPSTPAVAPPAGTSDSNSRVLATPATRKLARTLGVPLDKVMPTGSHGRVTNEDVQRYAEGLSSTSPGLLSAPTPADAMARVHIVAPQVESVRLPAVESARPPVSPALEERVPFRGLRKRIADNMTRSKFTATHFTYVEEMDVTELVALRARARAKAAERGLKLTFLPFIIKAVVSALKKWPSLNASLDETTQEIVLKKYYHIGLAAQGPNGLMVTVLRDADQRSLFDIAAELERLGADAQAGRSKREDLVGSTFSISSLGKLGGVISTPIINFPEVGILGVHKIAEKPAVYNGEICIRSLMNLSISLDHRLVDGWDGAMFLQEVKTLLEDPTLMFMEMR